MNRRFLSENLITSVLKTSDNLKNKSTRDLSEEGANFMWYQILTDILINIPFSDETNINRAREEMVVECRSYYADDENELRKIDQFIKYYDPKQAVSWYTCDSFLYKLLNRALRTEDIDVLFKFRSFFVDLHRAIAYGFNQNNQFTETSKLIVYRGQQMSQIEFKAIQRNVHGFIAMNSFLSTTTNRTIAEIFAGSRDETAKLESVIFTMFLDHQTSILPYVKINNSAEDEVLLSICGTFCIDSVREEDEKWIVNLSLTNHGNESLNSLLEFIRENYIGTSSSIITLGRFLCEMGQFEKAQNYFNLLLNQNKERLINLGESEVASILQNCGYVSLSQGDYIEATHHYENALQIFLNISDSHGLVCTYLGLASLNILTGDYALAIEYLNKTATVSDKHISSIIQLDLTIARYIAVGMTFREGGRFTDAEQHLESAVHLCLKHYPKYDPRTGKVFINIGLIKNDLGYYEQAFHSFKQGLEIYTKSLTNDHPDVGVAYSNIGLSQINYGQYASGLENLTKAVELTTIHDSAKGKIFNNMGLAYSYMNDTERALEFYEKALKYELSYNPDGDYPSIATICNNIGTIYFDKQNYEQALLQFQRAIEFQMQSLPSNHPSLALTYNSIGANYYYQSKYDEALYYYRKAIDIQLKTLKWNHPDLAVAYNNIGSVHRIKSDTDLAKNNFELALEIALQCLPEDHPSVRIYREQLSSL